MPGTDISSKPNQSIKLNKKKFKLFVKPLSLARIYFNKINKGQAGLGTHSRSPLGIQHWLGPIRNK